MSKIFKNDVFDQMKYDRFKKFVADCVVDAIYMADAGIFENDRNLPLKYMKAKAREIHSVAEIIGIGDLHAFDVVDSVTKVISIIINRLEKINVSFMASTIETISFDECGFDVLMDDINFAFEKAELHDETNKKSLMRFLEDFFKLS